MRWFRSYRAKLQAVFLILGLTAIALTGWEASAGASAALREATYDRLTAFRQACVRRIERYFQDLGGHVLALSTDESVLRALEEFNAAWQSLPAASLAQDQALREYYRGFGPAAESWFPADPRTRSLQHLFLVSNPHPMGAKDRMLEAPGPYGRIHARYHPTLHRYQTAFGFYDILLIDSASARVLYTVFKEPDLGIRLTDSPYRASALGQIFERAMALGEPEQFVLADYTPYAPSHSAPAAFAAAPIWRAGSKVGVLAIQVSIAEVNRVMTADRNWAAEGFGRTGQAYIVGPDNKLRSDMRYLIEQPERHREELGEFGTAILRLRVAEDAARYRTSAPGTEIGTDVRGVPVLRSHAPLNVPGIDWALMAEIEMEEAFEPVRKLRTRILGLGILIACGFWIAASLLARSVTRPVTLLAEGAQQLGGRNFDFRLPVGSEDEIGKLAAEFNRMAEALRKTTVSKEDLQELAGRLITAQEDERRRVARELHDDLTQRLAAIAIEAGNVSRLTDADAWREGLETIRRRMQQLSDEVHRLSRRLHPAMLDDLGLVAAIESECRGFFEAGGPPVEMEVAGSFEDLAPETRLALYRIVQESLRNIRRHAGAESVWLKLNRSDTEVHVEIRDDGRGFDRSSPEWQPGLGLASMEERVRLLGGRIQLESWPGKGTRTQVWLPHPESSSPTTTAS